ncbi:MAG TPA: hypothetical protein VFE14_06245, partial [Micromonosporaceae bacterium]|nr:hypothetical protein [Micromonosporaceae bacterium]
MLRRLVHKPLTWLIVALVGAGLAFGLYWFQPWKLVVDQRVDEALTNPAPAASTPAAGQPSSAPAT